MPAHTILVIDDNAAARKTIRGKLESHGWSVLESPIGEGAAELAKQHAPDLIILNVSFTGFRGESVAKSLKLDPITSVIPIIALTLSDRPVSSSQPWIADTIDHGTSLPVLMAKLENALAKQKTQKPYVLVVDDEPDFVEILTAFLGQVGFGASGALDGRQALDVVHSVKPDAILLDLDMPHIDGWEFLSTLKSNKALADIRVVILTGKEQSAEDQERAKTMGASDYLLKPCELKDVMAAIQTALKQP